MKYTELLYYSYKEAYKKSRYWLYILYLLLIVQLWVVFTLPGNSILAGSSNLNWVHKFLDYFENTFKPDSLNTHIIFVDFLKDKLNYKLEPIFKLPPRENSNYYKSTNNLLDSLISFKLIDSSSVKRFSNKLHSIISESVPLFRKEHVARDDSLKALIGDNLKERIKLLNDNRNEFQKILDKRIEKIYNQLIMPQINIALKTKTEDFLDTDTLTYQDLRKIDLESYEKTKKFLKISIFKNPYIDLPLSARSVLLILMLITPIVYFYFTLLHKYYARIEHKIDLNNFTDDTKTPSIRNINNSINLLPISKGIMTILVFIFYTFTPIFIMAIYIRLLFMEELVIIFIFGISFIRFLIWLKIDKKKKY